MTSEPRYQNIPSAPDPPPGYDFHDQNEQSSKSILKFLVKFKYFFISFIVGFCFCTIIFSFYIFAVQEIYRPELQVELNNSICQKRLIGYYSGVENRRISTTQIETLTHIIFDGIEIWEDGQVGFRSEEMRTMFIDMRHRAKSMKPDIQIMFSIDDWMESGTKLSSVMADCEKRKTWIHSIGAVLVSQQLDGVELNWRGDQSKDDASNFALFARELRYQLERMEKVSKRKHAYLISMVSPLSESPMDHFVHEFLESVDFITIDTYAYNAPWFKDDLIGALSPLYSKNTNKSIDWSMNYFTCQTRKPSQLNFMLPFRGAFWENSLNSTFAKVPGFLGTLVGVSPGSPVPWREIKNNGFDLSMASWDDESRTPYIRDSKRRFLYFENGQSLAEKVRYMDKKMLGGVVVRRLEFDDDSDTLMKAVASVKLCSDGSYVKNEVRFSC